MNLGIGSWPARRAKVRPDDVAIVFEGRERTYREVDQRVTRLANALASAGVSRGDRVAYMGFNHPALLETFFAAGLNGVKLMHGQGSGALRKGLHDFLRTHPVVKNYRFATSEEGGGGVTVVEFK